MQTWSRENFPIIPSKSEYEESNAIFTWNGTIFEENVFEVEIIIASWIWS